MSPNLESQDPEKLEKEMKAGSIAEGRLDTRVGPALGHRSDEIADLARDFDRMAERIESLLAGQKRLLGEVSHELRSPLARLMVALSLARQGFKRDRMRAATVFKDFLAVVLGITLLDGIGIKRLVAGVSTPPSDFVQFAIPPSIGSPFPRARKGCSVPPKLPPFGKRRGLPRRRGDSRARGRSHPLR